VSFPTSALSQALSLSCPCPNEEDVPRTLSVLSKLTSGPHMSAIFFYSRPGCLLGRLYSAW
jgi:hypothetical protein